MERLWWQLPGPGRFLSRVAEDVRDGKSVAFCLPKWPDLDVRQGLRSLLPEEDGWHWYELSLPDHPPLQPARVLFSAFVPDADPSEIQSAGALFKEDRFRDRVIWIEGMTLDRWPDWREFLQNWAHLSRALPVLGRTLFLTPLVGELALIPPQEDICLTNHVWRGVVGGLDMTVIAHHVMQDVDMYPLERRVAISVISNLAQYDPEVALRLSREGLGRILNPTDVLAEIARERAWREVVEASPDKAWCLGMLDALSGELPTPHSAVLALTRADKDLSRRVWVGEVGVMLPYVEERRRELLISLSDVLQVPHVTPWGEEIVHLEDLEIGHIEYQVKNSRGVDPKTKTLVTRLKTIRNDLSHLQCLDPSLLHEELADHRPPVGRALAG